MDTIHHNENNHRGIFYIKKDNKTVAELTYSMSGDVMTIDHTEVDPSLEGKGTGTRLVTRTVEYAREQDRQVNPLCPFAEVLFDRNEDWSDVRAS